MPITAKPATGLDRNAEVSTLAHGLARALKRLMIPLSVLLLGELLFLFIADKPGVAGFALIAAGTLIALAVWTDQANGLPLLPMLVIQHLVAFGLPIVIQHEVLEKYPTSFITQSGFEVFVFCVALALSWRFGMCMMTPSLGESHALQGFNQDGMGRLERLGMILVGSSTAYQALSALGLLDTLLALLPTGSGSLINVVVASLSTCGLFLGALILGSGHMTAGRRVLFWSLLAVNCLISASAFLLSSMAMYVFSVLIGLIWSTGRIPWRFVGVTLGLLVFLSPGKYAMRDKYWALDTANSNIPTFNLVQMPALYAEWAEASVQSLTIESAAKARNKGKKVAEADSYISILERVNNLQNLLYVVDAMETNHIPALGGATYSLIPPLLVPRILWENKPRTHEGQVMLNVHFGRQDANSTIRTYIAWGLLAEAYGNYGPITGALLLGLVLGLFCAWLENYSSRKLVLSLEGFLGFAILLGIANSFEMVASVLITTIFQSLVPIVLAATPFVERIDPRRQRAAASAPP
ncbi:MAG: hypothetical protein RLZZ15_4087 [Verrucomicrobiota bacterium]|jgi:hypothetical protein